ncbi:DUF1636 family protein [Ruegeria meonggei]|uniref:Metal-binding protein n=1 Tax=Ruegeria meonggei TaxID=1446476 RepID=A0A1X6YB63_9RHOB|nr:DUF1636 family protein [Ruegeria meonggei]SLN16124.1 hypothetical protein RUM8411_00490 [Ruegeria meonggei]
MAENEARRTHKHVRIQDCADRHKTAETCGRQDMRPFVDKLRLSICSSCAGARDHAAEAQAVQTTLTQAGLEERVEFATHACFSSCAEPTALALQSAGRASYVFSGINVVADAGDIAKTCQTYLDSPKGWIEDARPCGRLRMCLRTRIPAL